MVYDDNLPFLLDRTRISASNHQDDTQGIAYSSAWEALAAADPDIANAIEARDAPAGDAGEAYAASCRLERHLRGVARLPEPVSLDGPIPKFPD